MPARLVVANDDPSFLAKIHEALRDARFDAVIYSDSMTALNAMESAHKIELLVTGIDFGPGKPNGIALARMARFKRSGTKVLFTGAAKFAAYAEGLGMFMALPVKVEDVVEAIRELLTHEDPGLA
jgi:DNA-binding NtrC family response regulator